MFQLNALALSSQVRAFPRAVDGHGRYYCLVLEKGARHSIHKSEVNRPNLEGLKYARINYKVATDRRRIWVAGHAGDLVLDAVLKTYYT